MVIDTEGGVIKISLSKGDQRIGGLWTLLSTGYDMAELSSESTNPVITLYSSVHLGDHLEVIKGSVGEWYKIYISVIVNLEEILEQSTPEHKTCLVKASSIKQWVYLSFLLESLPIGSLLSILWLFSTFI